MRKNTRAVRIGGVTVGGGNPVAVQSMLNVPIHDIAGNVAQAKRLEAEGCQIVRVTVPSVADVPVVEALKNAVKMPVVADIHFDYKVALACAEAGVDKIRINPGNIGDDAHVGEVASACRARGIPIRIGVTAAAWKRRSLQNTERLRRKRWWRARCTMCRCWKGTISTILSSLSNPPMSPWWWKHTASSACGAITLCMWALPRPVHTVWALLNQLWA